MTQIDFYADGQRLKIIEEKPLIVEKSKNEYEAVFNFSDDWKVITEKNAVFRRFSDNKSFTVGLDENDSCLIPWEVIQTPRFYVSAYGGNLRTMTELSLNVEKSGYDENAVQSGTVPQPVPIPTDLKLKNNKLQLTAKGEAVGEGVELPEITVDTELSDTSENPVQNKVVKTALDELKDFVIQAARGLVSSDELEIRLQNAGYATYDDINQAVQVAVQNAGYATIDDINNAVQGLPTYDYVNQAIQDALLVNADEVIE